MVYQKPGQDGPSHLRIVYIALPSSEPVVVDYRKVLAQEPPGYQGHGQYLVPFDHIFVSHSAS
jgi:hypothetical protein